MFRAVICLVLLFALPAQAANPTDEIAASEYGALMGIKQISPKDFREKILPGINEAMKDGKITYAELDSINKTAGSMGAAFHKAAKSKSVEENVGELLKQAETTGVDLTDTLNKALRSGELSKLFDGAVDLFRTPKEVEKPTNEQITEL